MPKGFMRALTTFLFTTSIFVIPLQKASATDLSPDWVAMVVATAIVAQKSCGIKANNYPLNLAVAKLGQDLVDFEPEGKYAPLVKVKMKKAVEWIVAQGKPEACAAFKGTLEKFLPDTMH